MRIFPNPDGRGTVVTHMLQLLVGCWWLDVAGSSAQTFNVQICSNFKVLPPLYAAVRREFLFPISDPISLQYMAPRTWDLGYGIGKLFSDIPTGQARFDRNLVCVNGQTSSRSTTTVCVFHHPSIESTTHTRASLNFEVEMRSSERKPRAGGKSIPIGFPL